MPLFTTSFSTPPALTGLVAVPDAARSTVTLTWDVSTISAAEFYRYYVYRQAADGSFVRAGYQDVQANPTYVDLEAPHGLTTYAVSVSNGWDEGDSDTTDALLELDYWIVDPFDPTLVFAVPHVSAYDESFETQREVFRPLERSTPIAIDGPTLPAAGTVAALLLVGEGGIFDMVRRASAEEPYVVLKSPFGDVHRVKLGNVKRSRAGAGTQTISFDYLTVDA